MSSVPIERNTAERALHSMETLLWLGKLLADDSYAASFQTVAQYRLALMAVMTERLEQIRECRAPER